MRDTLHTGSSVVVVSSNRTLLFRVLAALLAGMIALAANMALLSIASASGIPMANTCDCGGSILAEGANSSQGNGSSPIVATDSRWVNHRISLILLI